MSRAASLANVLALFLVIVLINQWRRGTLGAWTRSKVLGLPPSSAGTGGAFTPGGGGGSGGGGGGAWGPTTSSRSGGGQVVT